MDPSAPTRPLGWTRLARQPVPSQSSNSLQKIAQPLHDIALEKGVMHLLPSSEVQMQRPGSRTCFRVPDTTPNGIPTAARLSEHHCLFYRTLSMSSEGWCGMECWHCQISAMRPALLTVQEQFLPVLTSCTHVPDVKASSDIKIHCSALAVWKNKITGWSAKQAGGSGTDRGRKDKLLILPSAPNQLVILIYV